MRRGDWVKCETPHVTGLVLRAARDGSWADVRWRCGGSEWTKRMETRWLTVVTRITSKLFEVVDMTAEDARKGGGS